MNDDLTKLFLNSKVTLTRLDAYNMICNNLPDLHKKAAILDVKACLARLFPQQEAVNEEELKAFTLSRCDNSLFDPRNSPNSPANQLIWQFTCLSYPHYSNSKKMALWCPALTHAKSIIFNLKQRRSKASSSTHRSKRQRIEGCTEVTLEYKDLDNLAPIGVSDLAHFVFLEENKPLILDMRQFSQWSFLAHKFFYIYIKEMNPSWVSKIYTHNSSYRELKDFLAIHTSETNTLEEHIGQLIKALIFNGTLRTGNEYAGEQAYSKIALFKDLYFEMLETYPDIAYLSTQDEKTLQWIIDNCFNKEHCVETTALYLRQLLNANQGAHLLLLPMTQSKPNDEPLLTLQSKVESFRTMDAEIPLSLLRQAMAKQPATDINIFIDVLIGFPVEEYKHVLKAINIKFKRLDLIHFIEVLPALGSEQLNELLECFYRDRVALKLPWQWLLSLAFNQSNQVDFLEKCIKAYKDSDDRDDKLTHSGCNWTFIDEAIFQNNKALISKALGVFKHISFAQHALTQSTRKKYGIYLAASLGVDALFACLQAFPEYQWSSILLIILQNTPKEEIKPIKKNIKALLLLIDSCHRATMVKFLPQDFKTIPEFYRYNPNHKAAIVLNHELTHNLRPSSLSDMTGLFKHDYRELALAMKDTKIINQILISPMGFLAYYCEHLGDIFKCVEDKALLVRILMQQGESSRFPISILFNRLDILNSIFNQLGDFYICFMLFQRANNGRYFLEHIPEDKFELFYLIMKSMSKKARHIMFKAECAGDKTIWQYLFGTVWTDEQKNRLLDLCPLSDVFLARYQEKAHELPKTILEFSIDYNNILFLEDDIKRQKQDVIFEIMSNKGYFIRKTRGIFLRLFNAFTYEQQFNLLIPEASEDTFPICIFFDDLPLFRALVKQLLPAQVLALLHVKTSKGIMLLEQISMNHQEIIFELTNALHESQRHVIFSNYSTEFWMNHFTQWKTEDLKKLIALIPLVSRKIILRNAYPQSLSYPPDVFQAFVEGFDRHELLSIFDYINPIEFDVDETASQNIDFLIGDATDEQIDEHPCLSILLYFKQDEEVTYPPSPVY